MKKIFSVFIVFTFSVFGVDLQNKSCPSQNFNEFLRVYIDNISVQKVFVIDPLNIMVLYPDDESEPKQIVKKVNKKDLKFPLIMNATDQKKNGLVQKVEKLSQSQIKLILSKPDTGWLTMYFFRYKDSCWKLEKIDDESM
jgi:disulfide oxidoreductase YuzD